MNNLSRRLGKFTRLIALENVQQARAVGTIVALLLIWTVASILFLDDWLDRHAGLSQGIFSGLLVIATLTYALYTRELIVKTHQQRRPYVYVEVVQRGALLDAVLRNGGERGAENIRLTVDNDVVAAEYDSRGILGWPLFQTPVPFLPPGRAIVQTVAHMSSMGLGTLEPDRRILRYRIEYDHGTFHYAEEYAYDLSFLLPVGGEQFPLAGDYLGQLNQEVEQLHKTLARGISGLSTSVQSITDALRERQRE